MPTRLPAHPWFLRPPGAWGERAKWRFPLHLMAVGEETFVADSRGLSDLAREAVHEYRHILRDHRVNAAFAVQVERRWGIRGVVIKRIPPRP